MVDGWMVEGGAVIEQRLSSYASSVRTDAALADRLLQWTDGVLQAAPAMDGGIMNGLREWRWARLDAWTESGDAEGGVHARPVAVSAGTTQQGPVPQMEACPPWNGNLEGWEGSWKGKSLGTWGKPAPVFSARAVCQ